MNRTSRCEVRFTDLEMRLVRQGAKERGITLSELIRMGALQAAAGRPIYSAEELDLIDATREQLRRAGINLNTLLRQFHRIEAGSNRPAPTLDDFAAVTAEVQVTLDELRRRLGITF